MKRRLALIFALSALAYLPSLRNGFVWDDNAHVTAEELQSFRGLAKIWFHLGATQQYYPVLHTAFWVEHRLWGNAAFGYHAINLLLHALASCLVAVAAARLFDGARGRDAGFFAGALFALHPVGVETVAWVSEQKNTLSAVLYLLSALSYLKHTRRGYSIAFALFLLALGSKTVTATLPAALLLVAWWKRPAAKGLSWRVDIFPLLPWFAFSAAAAVVTSWVERRYIGAEGLDFHLSFLQRGLLAGRVVWFYAGKLAWPAGLMFIYPHWAIDPRRAVDYLPAALAAAALAGFWLLRRRSRGPLAAALYFGGTLFPALGFVNVYPFLFSYVADHFQYLARLGVLVPAGAWLARVMPIASSEERVEGNALHLGKGRLLPGALACSIAALFVAIDWREQRQYRSAETLYRETLARNPNAWLFHNNLGVIDANRGRLAEAEAEYERSLALNDHFANSWFNLGNVRFREKNYAAAIPLYRRAVLLLPTYGEAHLNLGAALAASGDPRAAVDEYREAIRIDPRRADAHNDLGVAYKELARFQDCVAEFSTATALKPDYAAAWENWAVAECDWGNHLQAQGQVAKAIPHYRRALELRPGYVSARNDLAVALFATGHAAESAAELETARRLAPEDADVRRNLSIVLQSLTSQHSP